MAFFKTKKIIRIILICLFMADKLHAQNTITINFIHAVGTDTLQLDQEYTNPHAETFSIINLKYYIHNLRFVSGNKTVTLPDTYYLIDERKPDSKQLTVDLPPGNYTAFHFTLGVDSIKNVSGVQTGALDPVFGMFWTWNSGYIMAKFEGKSPVSTAPFTNFTYHIGGFKKDESVIKDISLPLAAGIKNNQLTIRADVNKWFSGVNAITIKQTPYCMNPGTLATTIATNYAAMFSVD